MFDIFCGRPGFPLLAISIALTIWVCRVAFAYGQALNAGVDADWRALAQAVAQGFDLRHAGGGYGVRQGLFAALMFACGIALYRTYSSVTAVVLFEYGFVWVLALMAQIDQRTGLLIDALSYPLIVAGLVLMLAGWTVPWQDGMLAAAVVGTVLFLARCLVTLLCGREAIGLGDIKVFIAIGLWIGLQGVLTVLLLANLLLLAYVAWRHTQGAVTRQTQAVYPFGPFVWISVVLFYVLSPMV